MKRPDVLKEMHDAPTAGHMGIAKTIARIAAHYYWPGMFRDVTKYVRSCDSCLRFKSSQMKPAGKMQPSRNHQPWECVSTDLVGPLPRSTKGNTFLVVFQDRFTKWVQCRPVRKATAKAVTQALYEEVVTRFGCPKIVLSDNGTQFTGHLFSTMLEELGITHRRTPPYTPQANPVERTNKTLKTMIAQFCDAEHRKWDLYLPELMFAINTARQDSTGHSPAFLNFGRELEVPKAIYRTQPPLEGEVTEEAGQAETDQHTERMQHLQDTFQLVRVNLAKAFTTQSRHYNLRRREWRCHIGDRVMKREHHLSSAEKGFAAKLAPKYSGPYTVTQVVSPVVYNLKSRNGKRLFRVHVKDLRPVHETDRELA